MSRPYPKKRLFLTGLGLSACLAMVAATIVVSCTESLPSRPPGPIGPGPGQAADIPLSARDAGDGGSDGPSGDAPDGQLDAPSDAVFDAPVIHCRNGLACPSGSACCLYSTGYVCLAGGGSCPDAAILDATSSSPVLCLNGQECPDN